MPINRHDIIMERVHSFPGIPTITSRLLKLLDNPDTSSKDIENLVRFDPGLTANLLRMANSSYFGFVSKIGSVQRAVGMLGLRRVKQLVLATCLNTMMNEPIMGYDLPPGELWRHSIAVSVAAEALVKELGLPEAEEIFTAALLHDVGKLVLGKFVKVDLKNIEAIAAQGVAFIEAERQVLGTDHADIGAKILETWAFPNDIVQAVRYHHNPDAVEVPNKLTDMVHIANTLCVMMGLGIGREGLHQTTSDKAARRVGIRPGHLEIVASKTLEWVNDMTEILPE